MRHSLTLSIFISSTTLFALPCFAIEPASSYQHTAESFRELDKADAQFEMLNKYCVDCHNFEDWAGGVAFDTMRPDQVPEQAEIWEKVMRKLRGRLMPPAGKPRPDTASTDQFVAWMESYLDHSAVGHPVAGDVALHRLNRKEYANAIRDLLGINVDAPALLPQDATVEGFDNVAEALNVSPSFLDQSLTAARVVAIQAIGNPSPRPGGAQYFVTRSGSQHQYVEGLPLGTRGGMAVEHNFPSDGTYILNIADLAQALWVSNQEFANTLIATYDGEKFFEIDLGGGENLRAIDQDGDPAVDAKNAKLKGIKFNAKAGPHEVAVTFLHRSFAESEDRLSPVGPISGANIVRLQSFEISGPYDPTGLSPTPSRNQIFICYPNNAADEQPCAERIIHRVARKAFREPVSDASMAKLMEAYAAGRKEAGFDIGIRRALTAILASPKFLYRLEPAPTGTLAGSAFQVSDLALASRLSFFLWSTIPDDELLDTAEQGRLRAPGELERQVRRMLADPKADNLVSNFAYQWLNLSGLDEVDPDPAIFADIDFGIRDLFKEEARLFVGSIFHEDRNVTELLTADHTYLNERLAVHYGITDVKGDRFRRVTLDNSARWGLLGKGSVLMTAAYPDRTSPVLRGKYVMQYITGTPPAAPPPNVNVLKENVAGAKPMSIRERMESHRADPNCAGCHAVMDPLGFALENFDAVGRWRTRDRFDGTAIDTTGQLPDGTMLHSPDDLRNALMKRPEQFVQTLTERLMIFALGRKIEFTDMPTVRGIVHEAGNDDYRFSSLIMGIVESDKFQMKTAPLDAAPVGEVAAN